MSISMTQTTELEAVNLLLATIGEAPINTLEGAVHSDAAMAQQTLSAVLKEFQCEGWYFNTETDYPLSPDVNGNIQLPASICNVDVNPVLMSKAKIDVVVRGNRLYDKKNHTYIFEGPIKADILLLLPFNELPQSAKNYLIIRAARKYQTQVLGSQILHVYTTEEEARARGAFVAEDIRNSDRNILSPRGNSAMGYHSIFKVLRR